MMACRDDLTSVQVPDGSCPLDGGDGMVAPGGDRQAARPTTAPAASWSHFPDVLELSQTPCWCTDEPAPGCLFDWWKPAHGYAIPADGTAVGFAGPYLTEPGRWLSRSIARFAPVDAATGSPLLPLQPAVMIRTVYPGLLRLSTETDRATVRLNCSSRRRRRPWCGRK